MTAWPLARLERWFLRAGLFLLPLAYSWDTYDGYVLPKLLLARVLVTGMLILFLVRTALTGSLVVKRSALDVPLLAFVGSALLSTAFAYNQNVAWFGTYSRYDGLLTIATYAALFWLTLQSLEGPEDARTLLRVLLVSGYLVAVVAILQSMTDSIRQGQVVPAFGTLGQKNALGAFTAMLLPLAYGELAGAKTWATRLLATNALALIALCLFLTFSRSAWLGAAIAMAIVVIGNRQITRRLLALAAAASLLPALAVTLLGEAGGIPVQRTDLGQLGDRPVVWMDSLHLVASRPVLGFGPDNFGLVFSSFQSTDLHQQWDKAHAETLQVAATQGIVGVIAYALLIGAFIWAFWRGRRDAESYAVLAAWVGYQLTIQVNFSALAAALPFWIFSAAAMEILGARRPPLRITLPRARLALSVASVGSAVVLGGLGVAAVVFPYLADAQLLSAARADFAGRSADAMAPARQARLFAPRESVYAVEVGNIAFERSDWAVAREAYGEAARLGTFNPFVYRNLALADRNLGRLDEAHAAAREAVRLDRFDPANQALLAQFEPPPS